MLLLFLASPIGMLAQEKIINEGVPADLDKETLIILKHEAIEVGTEEESESTRKYVIRRQENHNRVLLEFNAELEEAAEKLYPFQYILAFPSEIDSLMKNGHKYVLYSNAYVYDYLKGQPVEGELIVFGYYIKNQTGNEVFQTFELDEMKIYDAKMIMRKLRRDLKDQFPGAF